MNPLGIYHLERGDHIDYDETAAFVIIAADEDTARHIAADSTTREASATWVSTLVTATRIGVANSDENPRIVLADVMES